MTRYVELVGLPKDAAGIAVVDFALQHANIFVLHSRDKKYVREHDSDKAIKVVNEALQQEGIT